MFAPLGFVKSAATSFRTDVRELVVEGAAEELHAVLDAARAPRLVHALDDVGRQTERDDRRVATLHLGSGGQLACDRRISEGALSTRSIPRPWLHRRHGPLDTACGAWPGIP
jgi:hypothetical protein